jgi:serine/threonine-protein kinase
MLFEMLTHRLPFTEQSSGELIAAHLYQNPPSLANVASELPPALTALVDRMLNKDPSARPPMTEVAASLAALSAELPPLPVRRSLHVGPVRSVVAVASPQDAFLPTMPETPSASLGELRALRESGERGESGSPGEPRAPRSGQVRLLGSAALALVLVVGIALLGRWWAARPAGGVLPAAAPSLHRPEPASLPPPDPDRGAAPGPASGLPAPPVPPLPPPGPGPSSAPAPGRTAEPDRPTPPAAATLPEGSADKKAARPAHKRKPRTAPAKASDSTEKMEYED